MSNISDAEQTCLALNDSGQVLLYQDKAYLRPAEVAEMVLQALPDTTKDLEDKLSILHQELQPLEVRFVVLSQLPCAVYKLHQHRHLIIGGKSSAFVSIMLRLQLLLVSVLVTR